MPFSTEPWDGSAGRWPDAASYCRSSLVDNNRAGSEKTKSECHFPVKAPGSDVYNVNALRAVVGGRGAQANFPGAEAARARARRLLAEYNSARAEVASGITFVDDEMVAASFTADVERRIIGGMIVPWGKVAKAMGAKWQFAKGSLRWADTRRVKLNLNHDHKQPIAYASRLHNTVDGLEATFKVAGGEEGDRALALAEDGVLDGFSIEVDFDDGDEWQPSPQDRSIRLVNRGRLAGVALTGFPAFDDARADRVAAARQGGDMPEEETTTMDDEKVDATFETALERMAGKVTEANVSLSEKLATSVGESIAAGVKTALEGITTPGTPGTVRASRFQVTREDPVYRFDGSGESIVRDAWRAVHERNTTAGDDASERIRKYRVQSEDLQRLTGHYGVGFAPQTTTTASQIIPPGYRPDLYIPDYQKGRPFVEASARQAIPNATPFTVPTFGTGTTLTADHVQGTNPSDGSLTFGTVTVTPQAISGRLVLSRELVDSSNPAIDTVALYEMRESYARQTEAKVYTLLNGASGSGGTITAGFVPSGAQAATYVGTTGTPPALIAGIRAREAAYPFARFASPTAALMGSNATGILAQANDSTGRPIFPYVGATNTTGIGNAVDGGWSVDGLTFTPAWAITGTAAGDTQIFIFNRGDLWVFESPLLTFRFEEKQGPANIELNVFGYFGTALLRPVGLSGIRIT